MFLALNLHKADAQSFLSAVSGQEDARLNCNIFAYVIAGLGKEVYLCAELLDIQDLLRRKIYF